MILQLKSNKRNVNLIQNAPTANKSDDLIEKFYEDLNTVLRSTKKYDVTVIMGDFNAKVGEEGYTGTFELGIRNERGERFIEFCQTENFALIKSPREGYTSESHQQTIQNTL